MFPLHFLTPDIQKIVPYLITVNIQLSQRTLIDTVVKDSGVSCRVDVLQQWLHFIAVLLIFAKKFTLDQKVGPTETSSINNSQTRRSHIFLSYFPFYNWKGTVTIYSQLWFSLERNTINMKKIFEVKSTYTVILRFQAELS